jgi:hypothetical protein
MEIRFAGESEDGTFVWTGRALQAEFDDLEMIGLALLYPALERSICCSWPSWISAHIRSHSEKGPERPLVPPDHGCDGETVSPSPQSNSQTSAGEPVHFSLRDGSALDIPSAYPEHADVTPLLTRRAHRSCVPAPTQSR